jgi:hypothetical protein
MVAHAEGIQARKPRRHATLEIARLGEEWGSMKPIQARIADLWCRLMHKEPMWPSHGQYECRTCGRRHRVCWEQPLPTPPRVVTLARETQAQSALVAATVARV